MTSKKNPALDRLQESIRHKSGDSIRKSQPLAPSSSSRGFALEYVIGDSRGINTVMKTRPTPGPKPPKR